MQNAPIPHSLEIAAERCGDIAPLVYARLARELPEAAAQFRKEARLVQGEMLARAIEAILDLTGERAYAHHFIAGEAINHAGYDVPPQVFAQFFRILADTLRGALGEAWTPDMEAAWRRLDVDIATLLREVSP